MPEVQVVGAVDPSGMESLRYAAAGIADRQTAPQCDERCTVGIELTVTCGGQPAQRPGGGFMPRPFENQHLTAEAGCGTETIACAAVNSASVMMRSAQRLRKHVCRTAAP